MEQGRLRAGSRRGIAEPVELGNEPPLSVDGSEGGLVDRRRVSIHWLSGTILTGLCGAALMGGAVFASLDGQTSFTAAPERFETALRGAISGIGDRLGVHKTDRLPAVAELNVEREVLRVPTITRSRERETVRVRPYERVFGNLSLTASDVSAKIPPFNPQKILADAVVGDDQAAAPQPDAEVSFSTCDLAPPPSRTKISAGVCELSSLLPKVRPSTLLSPDEVMERVRDVGTAAGIGGPTLFASSDPTSSIRLGYAPDNEPDPYLGFEARIVPMNVTLLSKAQPNPTTDPNEQIIAAKKGETVGVILRNLGIMPDQIKQILAVLGPQAIEPLREGERVRVLLAPPLLGRVLPLRVIVEDSSIQAAAALSDMNTYVPVDVSNIDTGISEQNPDPQVDQNVTGVSLYQSLYETALRNNVPEPVIDELVRIYAYDVDFQRKVEPGDAFDVLYAEDTNGDGTHEVRYASLTVGGEAKRYYHFRTPDDGQYDYYDDSGKSSKKFLVRKPVAVGVETSPFGWRVHPLLHIKEFHSGVDWGAPFGTPIFAGGNGTIEEIGPRGGYGKYVRIRHADGYETAYGHMSAFARGLEVGSHVRQGQVIGFVGSTGMSTGSHVHYEIWVNGRVVDPMRIKLPRGRVLDGGTLAEFERDRIQLDALLTNAPVSHVAAAR
ncbi:MAG TPA: M23 family metallopeptidase [Xanthobacteraceae bacterium]|nr:M23 family metallopeptidase [Xanthobacteraceae bacterium]